MKADLTEQAKALDPSAWTPAANPDLQERLEKRKAAALRHARACLRVEHSREISNEEVEAALIAYVAALWENGPDGEPKATPVEAMRAALLAAQAKRREQIG